MQPPENQAGNQPNPFGTPTSVPPSAPEVPKPTRRNIIALILVAILLLGFITPLGSVLFFPMIVFAIAAVIESHKKAKRQFKNTPPAVRIFSIFASIGLALVILIGVLFTFTLIFLAGFSASDQGTSS